MDEHYPLLAGAFAGLFFSSRGTGSRHVSRLAVKILIVGSGGREHALAWKLSQSPRASRIFCAPGNAGTADLSENVPVPANDLPALARFAKHNNIDLTVVGPDAALADGIANVFERQGLRIFGPNRDAAQLESSKFFARNIMRNCNMPTPLSGSFNDSHRALRFAEKLQFPLVIKADGLAQGKGVIVARTVDEGCDAIAAMMDKKCFGEAGRRIVIEEFLRGTECSVHALVSGKAWRMLATARDHKRALDGDEGPNTGGMGAVSPADNWTPEAQAILENRIMNPLMKRLEDREIHYRGLLFPGLMLTKGGPQVLEFNCRFGDPEAQAILPRLKSDLLDLLETTIDGNLHDAPMEWDTRVAVTVVMASAGYPGQYQTGKTISGLESCAELDGVHVFHAGTRRDAEHVITAGGRVLAITALGETMDEARARAYEAVGRIQFEGAHYRRDIALPAEGPSIATGH